ncbi:MAG: hypothetical protein ACREDS_09990, partial [Limisphaerales bacterium]
SKCPQMTKNIFRFFGKQSDDEVNAKSIINCAKCLGTGPAYQFTDKSDHHPTDKKFVHRRRLEAGCFVAHEQADQASQNQYAQKINVQPGNYNFLSERYESCKHQNGSHCISAAGLQHYKTHRQQKYQRQWIYHFAAALQSSHLSIS